MSDRDSLTDPALEAANLALVGKRREASGLAAIEFRLSDPETGPWELAALFSVGCAALLTVVGVWFL